MKLREEYNSKFDFDSLADFKDEVVKKYPKKVGRKRAKAIQYVDPDNIPETQANVRTIPGIITQRGCTYAGCKGVVLGPSKDIQIGRAHV